MGAGRGPAEHPLLQLTSAPDGRDLAGFLAGQSITGRGSNNEQRFEHHQDALSYTQYLGSADFWEATLQNWQSEFLAVGSMAIFAVYLRQRGSPESKPVGAAHADTGQTG